MQNVDVQGTQCLLSSEALRQLLSYLRMKNKLNDVCYVNMRLTNVNVDWIFYLESIAALFLKMQ